MKKTMRYLWVILVWGVSITPANALDTLEIFPRIDIPLTIATGGVGATIAIIRAERFVPITFEGDRQLINPIDRPFAGVYRPRAATVSDFTLGATIVLFPAILAFTHEKPNSFSDDVLLVLEAFSVANLLLQITKTAVSRPRPLMYARDLTDKQRRDADNFLSFFSGHASVSFTFATMTSMLVYSSDVSDNLKTATAGVSFSLATATAALRVVAGKHYLTDVVSGALIGAATSMIVIQAHKKDQPARTRQTGGSTTIFSFSLPL